MAPIRLTEKYLRQISAFVDSIAFGDDWWDALNLDPFDVLVKSAAKIHDPLLSERDVKMALIHELMDCVQAVDLKSVGSPIPPTLEADMRKAVFEKLRDLIESLPWCCEVKFPLPRFNQFGQYELKISDDITLRYGLAEPQRGEEPFSKLLLAAMAKGQHSQLCVKVRGYADSDPSGNAVSQAISLAKQCLYFLGSFSSSHLPYGNVLEETYAVHPQGRVTISLPDTLTRYLCGLAPKDEVLLIWSDGKGNGSLIPRAANKPEERVDTLSSKLEIARRFFGRNGHPDYQAVGAAIEWYVDSITADNQTFAYIAACIGLEALLGLGTDDPSEKMEAMSSRLSDRYGFLLGVGRADRAKLSRQFREMLVLRGKLVHARSNRLNADEMSKLHGVQNMLEKVIGREIVTIIRPSTPGAGLFGGGGT